MMMDEMETTNHHSEKPKGGWRAIKYILGTESFEKMASMSLIGNMTVYLQNKYNLGGVANVNVTTIWGGSLNALTLVGAIFADTFLGRFYTMLLGSFSSLLGMLCLTFTAGLSQLRPPACDAEMNCVHPQKWQLGILFAGLGFLSIGSGSIRPCNVGFGADQFDASTRKGRMQLESFFNWWYFSSTIAVMIALVVVIYIQTNVSWTAGFAILTTCLFISISLLLIGRYTYICIEPQGSIFVDIVKVIVAACRKRGLKTGQDSIHSFHDPVNESELDAMRLVHTDRFRIFDKAALITDSDVLDDQGKSRNGWRLCTLQQVEQLKCLISVLPVMASGIGCFICMDQQSAFGMLQAIQMKQFIGSHFRIPPGWMTLTSLIALCLSIFIYEHIYIRLVGKDNKLTMQQRITTGIIMSILCMLIAAVIEKQRRELAIKHGTFVSPLTVGLLLPQFVLSGLIEAFAAIAIMEFVITKMPESMRTLSGAVFFLGFAFGSFSSSLIVNGIHHVTRIRGQTPWLGGHDLNQNKLEYYYYFIAGLGGINLIYFIFYASRYVSGENDVQGRTDVESVQNSTN